MSPNPPLAEHGGRAAWVAFAWFAAAWAVAALADVLELVFFPAARFLWLDAFVIGGTAAGLPLLLVLWRRMAALGAAEEQYRALFQAHPNPMWIYDADTYRFLEVNAAATQQYGYSREEFLAMGVLDIRAPEDREAVKRAIREDGAVAGSVWRHLTKDGRVRDAEIASHRLRWRGHNARVTQARDVTERRRAQELVRQSEERLRLVLDSTGDGLYSVDLEENCLWCNPACARLLGFHAPEELIGRNLHALAHHTRANGEPYPIEACEMARAARAGQGYRSDDELLWRADGSSFHAEYRSFPIWRDNAVEGVVISFADIERRRAAEQALRQSEERLRSLSESGVFGLAVGRHDGVQLEANDAYLNMMGYSRQDLEAGRVRWDTATAPAFRDRSARMGRRLLSGQPVPPWRSEMVRKDGSHIPVLVALVPQPGAALNITLDLTELQQTERSLKATERRYQQLFERNLAGVFSLDGDGLVLEANAAFAGIASLPPEALVGAHAAAFLPGFADLAAELRRAGAVANRELAIRRPDGSEVVVLANVNYLAADESEPERIDGTLFDLTEYKRLEEQYRQAQKMEGVGLLAGGIAHDFNNLLTVINGYSGLLLASAADAETRRRLELVIKAGARAEALTRQLLAFSRKQVFQLQVLDLNHVVRDSAALLGRVVGEHYQLVLGLDPNLRPVHADPHQLEQVLMNLLVNARDAMPAGGRITVETQNVTLGQAYAQTHLEAVPGDYVLLAVTDTGVGMDAATRARVFEPFFTTKPVGQGTGLGLATVIGIVKQSGGAVAVYSEPGQGTAMKVYLPAHHAQPDAVPAATIAATPATGSETVLLVEDDVGVRELAEEALRACGYQVLACALPEAALEQSRLQAGEIALLVSDVVMPQMDGPALAARLRQQRPQLRVLFVSGYPANAIAASGAFAAGADFLQKPYTPDSLATQVRRLLDAAPAPANAPAQAAPPA